MAMKPTDQEIAALYREAGAEGPSADIDRSILSAARAAVAEQPLPVSWWKRWRLPVQALTSVLLVATLTVLVQRNQPAAPAIGPVAMNAPVRQEAPEGAVAPLAEAPAPAAAESKARVADSFPARRAPAATAPTAATEPKASLAAAPRAPAEGASIPGLAAGANSIVADTAGTRPMAKSEAVGSVEMQAAKQAPAASPLLPAKDWLYSIQLLIGQGRIAEARTSLEAFQRAYPRYVVPEPMRARLKQ